MAACPAPGRNVGLVHGLTQTVDCNVHALVHDSYGAMFGRNLALSPVFTVVLTLYVALIGYRLLLGRGGARLGELPALGLKLGIILAFTTSWATYQTVVFDLAFKGPEQVAAAVRAPLVRPHSIFTTDVYDGLQFTVDHLTRTAAKLAAQAQAQTDAGANAPPDANGSDANGSGALNPPPPNLTSTPAPGAAANGQGGAAAPANAALQLLKGGPVLGALALWLSAAILTLSSLGVILVSKVVLGLLLALGPVFIAACLFEATRGFAVGWLRTTFAFAFAPLAASVFLAFLLTLIEPSLIALQTNLESGEFHMAPVVTLTLLIMIFSGAFLVTLRLGASLAAGFEWPGAGSSAGAAIAAAAPVAAGQVLPAPARTRDRVEGVASAAAAMQQRDAVLAAGGAASAMRRINVDIASPAAALSAAGGSAARSGQGARRLGDTPGRHRFQRRAS